MRARLTLNGKEYEVELSEDQVSDIEKMFKPKSKSGFEHVRFGAEFYVSDALADLNEEPAFSNENLRDDYVRAIKLFLDLAAWQALNDSTNYGHEWYEIIYDNKVRSFRRNSNTCLFAIRFSSEYKANAAIDVFRDELEWYFIKFKPRLDT